MVAEIFRYDCSHIVLSLNDDDDDAKGGWGVIMSPKVMT